MIDPKQALTKFSDIAAAKAFQVEVGEAPPGFRYGELAVDFAAAPPSDDITPSMFEELAAYSISTIEELVGLALIDERTGTSYVDALPIDSEVVRGLVGGYEASVLGQQELNDWTRYRAFDYSTGCELELGMEPVAFPALPAVFDFAAPPPGPQAGPPVPGEVSLIDQWMSPIRDQQNRGTCTAFAGISCLEYHHQRFGNRPGVDLSEQFAFWNMVQTSGLHTPQAMFDGLQAKGACTEQTWPYYGNDVVGNDSQDPPTPNAVTEAASFRPGSVQRLTARSVDEIRGAIALSRPVAIGIPVYDSWFKSDVVRKYGNITLPLDGEQANRIGHAVALVGFADDATGNYAGGGYFIVRNSWGYNWATASSLGSGYGTLPYRYIETLNYDAWCISS